MKKFLDLDFGAALRRIFSGTKKVAATTEVAAAGEHEDAPGAETEAPVMLNIWTIVRNRYSAARALCTEIEVYPSAEIELHEGIKGYVLNTPNGENVVVEARTGSLVGHALEVVRDGVREMTGSQLNAQLDTAKKEFSRMSKQVLANGDFWQAIKMGGEEIDVSQDYQE